MPPQNKKQICLKIGLLTIFSLLRAAGLFSKLMIPGAQFPFHIFWGRDSERAYSNDAFGFKCFNWTRCGVRRWIYFLSINGCIFEAVTVFQGRWECFWDETVDNQRITLVKRRKIGSSNTISIILDKLISLQNSLYYRLFCNNINWSQMMVAIRL